jgi:4-hydroxy-3-polyprenylbenzoate decarboxylase
MILSLYVESWSLRHANTLSWVDDSLVDYSFGSVPASIRLMRSCSEFGTKQDILEANLRIVIGVTGASGAIYPLRLLEKLCRQEVEIHLILTRSGEKTLYLETGRKAADLKALAQFSWAVEDISAPLASGSFRTDAMVIAPCSIHTLSSITYGITSNLLTRAADVTLKERRRLILMIRESPLHLGHLKTMTAAAEMGAILAPPIPGF